jgi:zinc protease
LKKVIAKGVDNDALIKIIRRKEHEFINILQSSQSLTFGWIKSFFSTNDEFELFKRIDEFYKIKENMVQEFIKNYLDPFLMNELQVLPIPEDKKPLWVESKKLSEEMDAEILKKFTRTAPLENPSFVYKMPDPKKLDYVYPKPDRIVELKNGLKVIFKRRTDLPLFTAMCRFKDAGFISYSKEGQVVDVMMDVLMEGSVGFTKKDNVDFFELYGASYHFGSEGAGISMVNVGYKQVLKRLFHVLTKPKFNAKALEKEKNIFIDRLERQKDDPWAVANRLAFKMVYRDHPYGWSFDEAIASIKKLKVADIKKLHKRHVSPANMMVVVAGDFDLDKMEKTIEEIFGGWKGEPYKKPEFGKGKFIPGQKIDHKMLRDQVALVLFRPSPINVAHPDRIPLRLLNFISFYSLGSRLYELRERTGLFYMAFGGLGIADTKVHGFDYLGALLSIDKLDLAEKMLKNLLSQIGAKGITLHELDDARQWRLKGLIDLVSTNESVASSLAFIEEFGLGFDYYDQELKTIQKMSVDTMKEICKKYANSIDFARVRVGRV